MNSQPVYGFGTRDELADVFGVDLEELRPQIEAALAAGAPPPEMEPLGLIRASLDGHLYSVALLECRTPEWLRELADVEPRVVEAFTIGLAGHPVIGCGDSAEEALVHLRDGLRRDAQLVPRGKG